MTGRAIGGVLENDGESVFTEVRHILASSDIVGGNLESPLTDRPHVSDNENMLEADPATAANLADAGFDLVSLPNNHSSDAGEAGLLDTIDAARAAGLVTVGAGEDLATAAAPTIIEVSGLTVGFLAFDATGIGLVAAAGPGVVTWNPDTSIAATTELSSRVDIVVVSVHGGAEYLPVTDPAMVDIGAALAAAGADVVWGHGAHVIQPVTVAGDSTVVATSLGNFLFDQSGPDRTTGAMLEVVADNVVSSPTELAWRNTPIGGSSSSGGQNPPAMLPG